MDKKQIVTRFAPSPTGFMHIGNLRTALYAYLIARHFDGKFILRIEDTDRERQVAGAEQVIFDTLKTAGLNYDEGPNIGGPNAPYVQSQRLEIYQKYAKQLLDEGKAYYCFCTKEDLEKAHAEQEFIGYNRHCRNLSKAEVDEKLKQGLPYVIRQKVKLEGTTTYYDNVFGEITVNNDTLQDIVLIKSDGMPTYNFAHVIDDHLMGVTHVVRGNEYITSTPQYVQLHEALGWELPQYYHLPLIMGKGEDGTVSKLSKRHGAVSFADLTKQGYLPQAIINYVALLGWHPGESEQEFFTLDELIKAFDPSDIRKSSAIFDYDKLKWMNAKYIENLSIEEFKENALPYLNDVITVELNDLDKLCEILKPRIQIFSEIKDKVEFFQSLPDFDINLLFNDKKKTNAENSKIILTQAIAKLDTFDVNDWDNDSLFEILERVATENDLKPMSVMWVVRIALSGNTVTVGGATEIMQILGKEETLNRLIKALERLN